jgi:MFS family permease
MVWSPVICLTFYIIGFSLGWGPIPMLIMSEIFPARGRGTAGAIAIFFNWLTAFFITNQFLTLQDLLGQAGVFCFFALCCMFAVWFVWRCLPETKGKSLEDIELYFLGRKDATISKI